MYIHFNLLLNSVRVSSYYITAARSHGLAMCGSAEFRQGKLVILYASNISINYIIIFCFMRNQIQNQRRHVSAMYTLKYLTWFPGRKQFLCLLCWVDAGLGRTDRNPTYPWFSGKSLSADKLRRKEEDRCRCRGEESAKRCMHVE